MENQLFMIVIKPMKHKIVLILCFQMKQIKNMTYGFTIHFDIVLDFKIKKGDIFEESTMEIEKVFLGTFPIMLH